MLSFLRELLLFLRVRKKYWLAPIILLTLLAAVLLALASNSAVAPFIYTMF